MDVVVAVAVDSSSVVFAWLETVALIVLVVVVVVVAGAIMIAVAIRQKIDMVPVWVYASDFFVTC